MRTVALLLACAVGGSLSVAASAMTLDGNIEALRTAIDPAKGAPIAQPIYSKNNSFPELGPPGPYTPEQASRMGLGGVAVIQCALASGGKLNKCTLLADGPLHFAYGAAALKMADVGYLKAKPPEGLNDGDLVRVIVVFPKPR